MGIDFLNFCAPSVFPPVLNDVPQVLNDVPNRTIRFAQSCLVKGEPLHLHIETSILGKFPKFQFSFFPFW